MLGFREITGVGECAAFGRLQEREVRGFGEITGSGCVQF